MGLSGSQIFCLTFLTKWINKNTVLMSLSFLYILFPFFYFYDIFVFNNKILYNICLDRHLLYVTLLFGFHTTTAKKSKSSSLDMLFLLSHGKIYLAFDISFFLCWCCYFFSLILVEKYSCDFLLQFLSVMLCFYFFYVCDGKWSEIQYIFDSRVFSYAIYFYDMLWPLSLLIWILKLKIQESIIFLKLK